MTENDVDQSRIERLIFQRLQDESVFYFNTQWDRSSGVDCKPHPISGNWQNNQESTRVLNAKSMNGLVCWFRFRYCSCADVQ